MGNKRWAKKMYDRRQRSSWRKYVENVKSAENIKDQWPRMNTGMIKSRVEKNGEREWRKGMENKTTLKWYKSKERIKKEPCGT